jgi:hypothetical protein
MGWFAEIPDLKRVANAGTVKLAVMSLRGLREWLMLKIRTTTLFLKSKALRSRSEMPVPWLLLP